MYLIFLFILGTVVGSFLNVCIHRLPRGLSIVFPPSHCPHCDAKLSALDLIPILSYFLLRGQCRSCGAKISPRYPLVEFLTGAAFLLTWIFQSPPSLWDYVFKVIFISVLIVIFFTDLEQQVIPDTTIKFGVLGGLIYNSLPGFLSPKGILSNPFVSALIGIFLGYFLLFAIALLGKSWFKKEALGEGDLYLAALLGAFLGWKGVLLSIFLAYLVGAAVSLFFLATGKVKLGQYIPFGPALSVGGIITLFWGERILAWYWRMFL